MSRNRKTAVEWPAGTTLTDEMIQYAELHGVDAAVEFESWRDYHLARGNRYSDWFSTWRTWCRNQERWKNEKRTIGFTAPVPRPALVMRAVQENEEIAREVASMTVEQRRAAVAKFQAIISGIKG